MKKTMFIVFIGLILVGIPGVWGVSTVSLQIQNGATATNLVLPNLSITADVNSNAKMRFSCNGTDFSPETEYSSSYALFNITTDGGCTTTEGARTVTVQVWDDNTSQSSAVSAQDDIIFDALAPTTQATVSPATPNGTDNWYIRSAPTVNLACQDATTLGNCQVHYFWNSETEQTGSASVDLVARQGENQLHFFSVDGAGNAESQQTLSLKVDTNAELSSIVLNDGNAFVGNASTIKVSLSGNAVDFSGNACRFSGDGVVDENKAFQSEWVLAWTPGADGTKTIQVQCTDIRGNTVEKSDSIIVDTSNPTITSLKINSDAAYTNNSSSVTINVAGSSDITHCRFGMDANALGSNIVFSSAMTFSWTTSGDRSYTVFGSCKDGIGNDSNIASDSISLDSHAPDAPTLSVYSIGNQRVTLRWAEVIDNGPSGLREFVIYRDGTQIDALSTSTREYEATGLTNGTSYRFKLVVRDNAGNESFDEETATPQEPGDSDDDSDNDDDSGTIDTTNPTVSWIAPTANATVSGNVTLLVRVSDNRSVRNVRFFLDGTATNQLLERVLYDDNSQMAWVWNSRTTTDGNHEIFARVEDNAGNSAVRPIRIRVNNAGAPPPDTPSTQETEARQALEQARDTRDTVDEEYDLVISLSGEEISNWDQNWAAAERLLNEADRLLRDHNYSQSIRKSNEAIQAYERLQRYTVLEEQQNDALTQEGLRLSASDLQNGPLNPQIIQFAAPANQVESERYLRVLRRETPDGNVFFIQLRLVVRNVSDTNVTLSLIELVPKVLARSANQLESDLDFTILQEDPLLRWNLEELAPNEEQTITYSVQYAFTQEELDAVLASEEMTLLSRAPLVVESETLENQSLLAPSQLAGFALLDSIKGSLPLIVGILVIVLVAGWGFMRYKDRQSGQHLGNTVGGLSSLKWSIGEQFKRNDLESQTLRRFKGR